MANTPKLSIPEVSESQSQKATTVNEGWRDVDALIMPNVADKDLSSPPAATDGDTYLVASGASGAWAGHANHIAYYKTAGWDFHIPAEGWKVYVQDENLFYLYTGAAWVELPFSDITQYVLGKPATGARVLLLPLTRVTVFPAALAGSQVKARVAADAEAVFSIRKNDVEFGTATFAAAGTVATLAAASAASFAVGDILSILAPTQDATLEDIGFALMGLPS